MARVIFDAEDEGALGAVVDARQSRRHAPPTRDDYFREHRTLSGWSDQVSAADLVPRLTSDVSPRLAQGDTCVGLSTVAEKTGDLRWSEIVPQIVP